ncbi:hypothetical protein WSM22_30440 [Cytophagales bacterium WSM2-2]|nr:hypothetical protein WSM22_30440 [Cytophagales bacterium WSM2-2]
MTKRSILTVSIANKQNQAPNSNWSNLEKVIKLFPLAYAIAVGLGLVDIVNYYNRFDIEIWRYLEFTDVLLYFINLLIEIILFSIGLGIFSLTVVVFSTLLLKVIKGNHAKNISLVIATFSTTIVTLSLFGNIRLPDFFSYIIVVPIVLIGVIYVLNKTALGNTRAYTYIFLFSFILAFEFYRIGENAEKYKTIKAGKTLAHVRLKLKSSSIFKTSDSILYFGSTRKYYFFQTRSNVLQNKHKAKIAGLYDSIKTHKLNDTISISTQIKLLKRQIKLLDSIERRVNFNIIIPESEVLESRIYSQYKHN